MRFIILLFLIATYINNVCLSIVCTGELKSSSFNKSLIVELGDRIKIWRQFLQKSPLRGYFIDKNDFDLFQYFCKKWGFNIISYVKFPSDDEYNAMLDRSKKCDKYHENTVQLIEQCSSVVLLDTKQTISNYLQCELRENEHYWLELSEKYNCGSKSIDGDLWNCLCKKEHMNSNMVNYLVFNFNEYWGMAAIAAANKFPFNIFNDLWDCDRSSNYFLYFDKNDIAAFLRKYYEKNLINILQYFPQCEYVSAYSIWLCTCTFGTSLLRTKYQNPKE